MGYGVYGYSRCGFPPLTLTRQLIAPIHALPAAPHRQHAGDIDETHPSVSHINPIK
jgi:hypothetical protein